MNEITIPYHLAIPTVFSFAGLVTVLLTRQRLFKKDKWLWTSATVFLAVYLFVIGNATCDDIFYQIDLNRYDTNQDGLFSGQEITKDQIAAMQRLSNDVGRNLSVVTGFIFAFIVSGTVFLFSRMKSRFSKR